ncbi:MAG: ferrochelatase [Burkholderiaceae bacterium]
MSETCVLLVQLGTPDAPEPGAVRRYLRQFLSDPRVVEIPRVVWLPILHAFVLTRRPRASADKYRSIWTPEGSPLLVNSQRQAAALQQAMTAAGRRVRIALAMRYGEPDLARVLRRLRDDGMQRLLVLPLYPQYSASTAASVFDAVWRELRSWRVQPEVRTIRQFHDEPAWIAALASRLQRAWQRDGRPDQLVLSFHGLPQRSVDLGDPYQAQCRRTAELLIAALGLRDDAVHVTFQSRFGKAKWLTPYTDRTLDALGRRRVGLVDVTCPGFVADCIETLEEIAIEGRRTFEHAGGGRFRYQPCLNDDPDAIDALRALCDRHLQGWPS